MSAGIRLKSLGPLLSGTEATPGAHGGRGPGFLRPALGKAKGDKGKMHDSLSPTRTLSLW